MLLVCGWLLVRFGVVVVVVVAGILVWYFILVAGLWGFGWLVVLCWWFVVGYWLGLALLVVVVIVGILVFVAVSCGLWCLLAY